MKGPLAVIQIVVIVIVALVAYHLTQRFFPKIEVVDKKIVVDITKKQLDSLELSFNYRLKAATRTRIVTVEDTARVKSLLSMVFALKDSLRGRARLTLYYEGLVGKYQDSLRVLADFIGDTIEVDFRANERKLLTTIKDTTYIGDSFFTDLYQYAIGAGIGYTAATLQHSGK